MQAIRDLGFERRLSVMFSQAEDQGIKRDEASFGAAVFKTITNLLQSTKGTE